MAPEVSCGIWRLKKSDPRGASPTPALTACLDAGAGAIPETGFQTAVVNLDN